MTPTTKKPLLFDIYVGAGFCEYETSSISQTLKCANDVVGKKIFAWRYISETPGMLNGNCGLLVRAEPAIQDYGLADIMVVVGGQSGHHGKWFARLRQMRRISRPVVLLSDAATTYIKQTRSPDGKVTTHWHDALSLRETGDHPTLTNAITEVSGGIMTSAGSGATKELIISLIAKELTTADNAELANRLMLPFVRTGHADQPQEIAKLTILSDPRIQGAVKSMEKSIESRLNISELADEVGVSTRHLERMFKEVFNQTPARFYKQIRTKRARALIEETQLSMMEISIATGFGSSNSLNEAIKLEYGFTATKMRKRQ